jgi:hypothetical protein
MLGGTALGPWIVSHTEPLARRLRGGARVAARGLARHRLRSGAVVAAIMAPAGVTIVASSAALTYDARERANEPLGDEYQLGDDEVLVNYPGVPPGDADRVLAAVREALPGAEESTALIAVPRDADPSVWPALYVEITNHIGPGESDVTTSRVVTVGSADGLRRLGAPDATIDAFNARKAVVFGLIDPEATLGLRDGTGARRPLDRADVAADPTTRVPKGDQIVMVSAETAERWGAVPVEVGALFRARADLTDGQVEAVRAATNDEPDEWLRQYLTDPERTFSASTRRSGRSTAAPPTAAPGR